MILSGASLFPFLLRNIMKISRRLVSWRYKIIYDYILLNHHHLSNLLFPTLQTRIYLCVTLLLYLLAISLSIILDVHNSYLAQFSTANRVMIFVFEAVSARFAGFQTVDISRFTSATLLIYLLLMVTKPQMLCALRKSRFELIWVSLQDKTNGGQLQQNSPIPTLRERTASTTTDDVSPQNGLNLNRTTEQESTRNIINPGDQKKIHKGAFQPVSYLFLRRFVRAIFKNAKHTFTSTRTWVAIFIFLICVIEKNRIAVDPNITVLKIVFEICSAFGCVGLSLGYPDVSSSFATILSSSSKVIIGITMLLGRHRGLSASMKDQEEIEHDPNDLLEKWRKEAIDRYETSTNDKISLIRL